MKIYEAQKTAQGYNLEIPSGFTTFGNMKFFSLKIKTPAGTLITKSLDINNLIPDKLMIKFILTNTDITEIGIYDYQLINNTSGAIQIGPVKQFYVRDNKY